MCSAPCLGCKSSDLWVPHLQLTLDSTAPAAAYRCISCEYRQLTRFPQLPALTTNSRQSVWPSVYLSACLFVSFCCRQTAAHISGNSPGRKCKSTAAKVFFGWNPRGMHRAKSEQRLENTLTARKKAVEAMYEKRLTKKKRKLDFERSVKEWENN